MWSMASHWEAKKVFFRKRTYEIFVTHHVSCQQNEYFAPKIQEGGILYDLLGKGCPEMAHIHL